MKTVDFDDNSTKGYKVRLYPNKKQRRLLFDYFKMSRFVYNECIDIQEKYYEKNNKRLSYETLDNIFINMKKEDKYNWLNKYSVDGIRGSIRDCCRAYINYDDNKKRYNKPKIKNYDSKKQFYSRPDRMSITDNYVKLSKIGKIKYCNSYGDEILGNGYNKITRQKYLNYYNSRISYDGLNFYLSFTIPKDKDHQINSYTRFSGKEEWLEQKIYENESIGIDVGVRNEKWMVDSTGRTVERPDSSSLRKRISRNERKYQRQKDTNLKKNPNFFKYHPNGSKNMQKTRARINKDYEKISNRRRNIIHEYACDLIELKPKTIVMESPITQKLIRQNSHRHKGKNKLNQMVHDAALYESTMIIERKAINNGIKVIRADSGFPSSQICSCCGHRQDIGRKQIYRCPVCGTVINRDLNAAINLANYMYIKDKYIQEEDKTVKITIKTC